MAGPEIYGRWAWWYRLLDPPGSHREEAECFRRALLGAMAGPPPAPTLLELGAGAGHNALHLKAAFRCTLADRSAAMLELSRETNPECEHVEGDMRTMRLGRVFDAVLVHDAVLYMITEDDLAACARTAFAHTRPGGAALFAPDFSTETWRERSQLIERDDGERSLRAIEWDWDPVPGDGKVRADYVVAVRSGDAVETFHDVHEVGCFPRAAWRRVLEAAGYRVGTCERTDGGEVIDEVFLCARPGDR